MSTTLPRRTLGKHVPAASNLGFGCMRLPLLPGGTSEDVDVPEAIRMIRRAIDAGVDYVDTAWPYHGEHFPQAGRSEPITGQALADGYRERVTLATKLPLWNVEAPGDMDRLLDEQLKRLNVNRIDVYLAHNLYSDHWEKAKAMGLLAFMDRAVKDGRIGHPAFSFHDQFPLFKEILESYDWHVAQIQYNYLDEHYQAGRAGLELAAARGVGVVVMEPLRGGFLVNDMPEDLKASLKAARPEWSLADWALRWLWNQPAVGTVLSGMSAMPQLEENLRIAAAPADWTDADARALAAVQRRFAERIQIGCTACGYCLPCPKGVAIPKVFSNYNDYFLGDSEASRTRARMFYDGMTTDAEKADRCVACGTCEPRCPQHLPIIETLKKAAALFHAPVRAGHASSRA